MSNAAVGNLYSTIIDRIVEAARNDFEEGGIPQETLEELKQHWRENLSSLKVAQLPWDPPPTPPHPQTLPSNATKADPAPQSAAAAANNKNGVPPPAGYVKQEPKQEPYQGYSNGYSGPGLNPVANERARQMLQQQFGTQANASIHAAGLVQPGGPRPLSLPGQHQQQPQQQQQQLGQQQGQQPQQQQRPMHIQLPGQGQPRPPNGGSYPQQQSSLSASQNDGSGDAQDDWNEVVTHQRAGGEHQRLAADGMLRAQLERNIAITDSGLFAPLANKPRKAHHIVASMPFSSRQVDGGDDDDDVKAKIELDEDAINSDLDDEDDGGEAVDDDGDGPVGETILCTYDKVQRVKNKWKCTLKDDILTTQGKEYVFHKANGEFEW